MGSIEYITTRELVDAGGKGAGMIKILKLIGEGEAAVDFKCPGCGSEESGKKPWSEPFVAGSGKSQSFVIKCGRCGYGIKLSRLKKDIKKKS